MEISVYNPLLYSIKSGNFNIPCHRYGMCRYWKNFKDIPDKIKAQTNSKSCWVMGRLKNTAECECAKKAYEKKVDTKNLFGEIQDVLAANRLDILEALNDNVFFLTNQTAILLATEIIKGEEHAGAGKLIDRIMHEDDACFATITTTRSCLFYKKDNVCICMYFDVSRKEVSYFAYDERFTKPDIRKGGESISGFHAHTSGQSPFDKNRTRDFLVFLRLARLLQIHKNRRSAKRVRRGHNA